MQGCAHWASPFIREVRNSVSCSAQVRVSLLHLVPILTPSPRMQNAQNGADSCGRRLGVRATGPGEGHQQEGTASEYSITDTCVQNQHCQGLRNWTNQLLFWFSVFLCCQMRSLKKMLSRNSSSFKILSLYWYYISIIECHALVFDLLTVNLKHIWSGILWFL